MSAETEREEGEGAGFFSSFMSHMEELRSRLVKCVLAVLAVFVVCYAYSGPIFAFIAAPIVKAMPEGSELSMIDLTEAFMVEMKVAIIAAIVFASPLIFYQLWKFVSPALHKNERKYVWQFVFSATFFFVCGAWFCYSAVLPWGLKFFLSYATAQAPLGVKISANISVRSAIDLALQFSLAMGVVFELPVVVYFLAKMGVVTYKTLGRIRRFAYVIIFFIAAILTPPDVLSQMMMAGPLMLLYEFSILVAYIFGPKPPREEPEPEEKDEEEPEEAE